MTDESRESTIVVPPKGIEPRKPRLLEQVHEAIPWRRSATSPFISPNQQLSNKRCPLKTGSARGDFVLQKRFSTDC
jgi:hypothetical protein